jgi:hypothetical protein
MQAGNLSATKVNKKLYEFFDKSAITRIGRQSGFIERQAQKISAVDFVVGFLLCCCKRVNTYRQWAAEIGSLSGRTVSKQAVFDRMGSRAVVFAEKLLKQALCRKLTMARSRKLFGSFGKILLHDSTTLRLPKVLAQYFKGNVANGEQKAVARIQTIIDIQTMRFLHLDLGSFTQNDQGASGDIDDFVSKGDLVIRDLGYFALESLQRIMEKQAYFLSRLRYGVTLYDLQGNEINWKTLLKHKGIIDIQILIGKKQGLPVRLLMVPLPQAIVSQRIRKARNDRDKRLNHGKEYYQWLSYNVFTTNVEEDIWTAQQAATAYKARWQVEIIFKTWKSGFHLQEIFHEGCTNEHRVRVNIFLILLFMCLFMQKFFMPYKDCIQKQYDKTISLMKLSLYISSNLLTIFMYSSKQLKEQLAKHCCYDKRADRVTMDDLLKIFKT